jgi:MFS superfamily sulfate permease-like transporter
MMGCSKLREACCVRLTLREISGSLGDLGTLIPLLVGMAHQGSVHFVPALFFAGLFNVLTGLLWDVPMCVQPMKTIAAVALADGLTQVQVSIAGMLVSAIVLMLGLTKSVIVINNVVPNAVVRGMQLGLGLSLARRGLEIVLAGEIDGFIDVLGGPVASCTIAALSFVALLLCRQWPRVPFALLLFLFGLLLAALHVGVTGLPFNAHPTLPFVWALENATGNDISHALLSAALPQLPLTTLNSVVSVCALAKDFFPERPVSQTSVAISVGLMNLVGCLLGAIPACHGAGGLAAQHHFGARRGVSMIFLGSIKMLVAITLGSSTLSLLDTYPNSVMGVLLISAGLELAKAGSNLSGEPDLTIGLVTAASTLSLKTGLGCVVGLSTALCCGGVGQILALAKRGVLCETLLRGTAQPVLRPYLQVTAVEAEDAAAPARARDLQDGDALGGEPEVLSAARGHQHILDQQYAVNGRANGESSTRPQHGQELSSL